VPSAQVIVANLCALLLAAALAGVIARGRARLCWSFVLYLGLALTTNRLVAWWPSIFWTREFWARKEAAFALIEVLVALELAWATLRRFTRARVVAVVLMAIGIGLSTAAALTLPGHGYGLFASVIPRVGVAGEWLLVALLAVASWYRLPLHPFHRRVGIGFALYTGAYVPLLGWVSYFGWGIYPVLAAVDSIAYGATVGLWAAAAWSRGEEAHALEERLWWEAVSPGSEPYYAELAAIADEQRRVIRDSEHRVAQARKTGDVRAAELEAGTRRYVASVGAELERITTALATRKRMVSALRRP